MCFKLLRGKASLLAGVTAIMASTTLSVPALAGSPILKEKLNDLGYTVTASEIQQNVVNQQQQAEYALSLHNELGQSVLKMNQAQLGPLSGLMLADVDGDGVREIIVSMNTDPVEKLVHFVDIFQFNGQSLRLIERNLTKINPSTHEIWLF